MGAVPIGVEAVVVQPAVDRLGAGWVARVSCSPGVFEVLVVVVAALAARPVAGGQRGGFVKEVQLGEPVGPPLGALPAVEFEPADDPVAALAVPDGFAVNVQ